MKVEAILAHDRNYVIGQGDVIPWHHKGDFARFKKETMGHSLLMGPRTFFGIAENYFRNGGEVLPGRRIFVLGKPKGDFHDIGINEVHRKGFGADWIQLTHEIRDRLDAYGLNDSNVVPIIYDDEPKVILDRIRMYYNPQKLLIAGGAKTYKDFMHHASTIHVSVIDTAITEGADHVRLFTETIELLKHAGTRSFGGHEVCNGLLAYYDTVVR